MDTQGFWQLIEFARGRVADPADAEAVTAQVITLLAARPRQEIVAAQHLLSGLMADSYRTSLWAAAYVINGGCSDDGFDYFRGWLILQGRDGFNQAVTNPDSLADLAPIRLAVAHQTVVVCEPALYIPAEAHRLATREELPADAYRPGPLEPVGSWSFDFDDQRQMKRRLPRLTALCWPDDLAP